MFDHLINDGPFSEADAARLIRETASALTFLHGIGVLHADLKPENLMLCSTKRDQGTIKVVSACVPSTLHHLLIFCPPSSHLNCYIYLKPLVRLTSVVQG